MTRQDDALIATKIEEHSMVGTDDLLAGIRALECWRAVEEGRWWQLSSANIAGGSFHCRLAVDDGPLYTDIGFGATPAAAVAAVLLVIANETAL